MPQDQLLLPINQQTGDFMKLYEKVEHIGTAQFSQATNFAFLNTKLVDPVHFQEMVRHHKRPR